MACYTLSDTTLSLITLQFSKTRHADCKLCDENTAKIIGTIPLISVGFKRGNWKLSLNNLTFNELMNTIATNAFKSGIVTNYDDPLILALNLNVSGDFKIMKKIKEQIIDNFGDRLLDISYGYAQKNIALELQKNLQN